MVVYGNVQCACGWYHVFWDEIEMGEGWADPRLEGEKREKGNR
jgi:hypothetical protein